MMIPYDKQQAIKQLKALENSWAEIDSKLCDLRKVARDGDTGIINKIIHDGRRDSANAKYYRTHSSELVENIFYLKAGAVNYWIKLGKILLELYECLANLANEVE